MYEVKKSEVLPGANVLLEVAYTDDVDKTAYALALTFTEPNITDEQVDAAIEAAAASKKAEAQRAAAAEALASRWAGKVKAEVVAEVKPAPVVVAEEEWVR